MQKILSLQFSFYLVLATCFMHVFCCGIPLLLSLGSIAAVLGSSSGEWLHPEWIEPYETALMVASGSLLLLTGAVQFIASRINCRTDGDCHHAPCDKKKRLAQRLYWLAVVLFVLNLGVTHLTH